MRPPQGRSVSVMEPVVAEPVEAAAPKEHTVMQVASTAQRPYTEPLVEARLLSLSKHRVPLVAASTGSGAAASTGCARVCRSTATMPGDIAPRRLSQMP
ncbi:MAG: hypothetical protein LBS86_03095 [Treponema sp.]|nr:hypothetical protein [Treponema sp.]